MHDDLSPKVLDELMHLRAANVSLNQEVNFLREQCLFLREIINKFIENA